MTRQLVALVVGAGLAAGCHDGAITKLGASTTAPDGAAAPAAPPPSTPALPPTSGNDAAPPSSPGRSIDEMPKCAEETQMAEHVPLDLILLMDRSSSMIGPKWNMSRAAIKSFIADPRSAGLGIGLQYFPLVLPVDAPCTGDPDCGFPAFGAAMYCLERQVCVGPASVPGTPPSCGVGLPPCAMGTTCVPLGKCTTGGTYCTNIGGACPAGGGTCNALGRTCAQSDFSESCTADMYRKVTVDVGVLPAAQMALTVNLSMVEPDGGTPMVQAVQGTLAYMRARLAAHPDHRMALVLATDGVPSFCGAVMGNPVDAVVNEAQGARQMTPSISTYTIGVFDPIEGPAGPAAVNRIALAGGTAKAFVLSPTSDLTQMLLGALEQIRGAALPCEFTIPPPRTGMIDFGKVNVHFKGSTGEEDVLYVGQAGKCDPMRGGWYYDVDPAMGTPTKVVVCDATCGRFKADASAQVELGFGCKTRVIE